MRLRSIQIISSAGTSLRPVWRRLHIDHACHLTIVASLPNYASANVAETAAEHLPLFVLHAETSARLIIDARAAAAVQIWRCAVPAGVDPLQGPEHRRIRRNLSGLRGHRYARNCFDLAFAIVLSTASALHPVASGYRYETDAQCGQANRFYHAICLANSHKKMPARVGARS
jgi:hypothetical protein